MDELCRYNRCMVRNLHILFGFLFLADACLMDFDSFVSGLILMESILGFVTFDDLIGVCLCFARFFGFGLIANHVVDFFRDMVCLLDFLDFLDFLYRHNLLGADVPIADMFVLFAGLSVRLVVILFVELA